MQRLAFIAGFGAGMLITSSLLLLGFESSGDGSVQERYVTWTQAQDNRLVDRGLLPSFAPKTSTEIVVRSVPETDQFRGSFRFPISEGPRIVAKLAVMPAAETNGSVARPEPYDDWWPPWLRGRLTAGPRGNPGYAIYRPLGADDSVESILVACNLTKGHCLYWSDSTAQ
jgi:hypothetical protein